MIDHVLFLCFLPSIHPSIQGSTAFSTLSMENRTLPPVLSTMVFAIVVTEVTNGSTSPHLLCSRAMTSFKPSLWLVVEFIELLVSIVVTFIMMLILTCIIRKQTFILHFTHTHHSLSMSFISILVYSRLFFKVLIIMTTAFASFLHLPLTFW